MVSVLCEICQWEISHTEFIQTVKYEVEGV